MTPYSSVAVAPGPSESGRGWKLRKSCAEDSRAIVNLWLRVLVVLALGQIQKMRGTRNHVFLTCWPCFWVGVPRRGRQQKLIGVSQNKDTFFGGSYIKDYGIWGSILGHPNLGELPVFLFLKLRLVGRHFSC